MVEEAFSFYAHTTPLCHRHRRLDARAARAARDAVSVEADLVELRLDGVRDIDVPGALAGRKRPVIVTCRPRREGGAFDGPEEQRLGVLRQAVELGRSTSISSGIRTLPPFSPCAADTASCSPHMILTGVPGDLAGRWRAMRATGAEVVKLAVMARALCDTLPLARTGGAETGSKPNVGEPGHTVLIAMGLPGLAEPNPRGPLRFVLDLRRRGCGAGAGATPPG